MTMNQDKIKALAAELAKDIKTPEDLSAFSVQRTKITVEAALNTELEEHLGFVPMRLKAVTAATVAMGIP